MVEKDQDFGPWEQDYKKWVEGQSTEALTQELFVNIEYRALAVHSIEKAVEKGIAAKLHLDPKVEKESLWPPQSEEKFGPKDLRCAEIVHRELIARIDRKVPERAAASSLGAVSQQPKINPEVAMRRVIVQPNSEAIRRIDVVEQPRNAPIGHQFPEGAAASSLAAVSQHRQIDAEVAIRRAIVKQCSDRGIRSTIGICQEFDRYRVLLPDGQTWELFRKRDDCWATAFNARPINEKRRKCIRVIIAHDKAWNRKNT